MRAALFQGPSKPGTTAHNLRAMTQVAAQAQAAGADLLVLPELFLTGYNIGQAALREAAEPPDGPSANAASAIARSHGLALLYGYPERGADGHFHNSAALIGADGAPLANYRKTHLFGDMERAVFTPGTEPFVLAQVAGMRIGLLICYDVEFPETVRGLALRGADLVAVPTALMAGYEFVPNSMIPTRAFENQIFLIYANRCGMEPPLTYVGRSCIVAPNGADLARAAKDEAFLIADLDPAAAALSRAENTYLQDRMPRHYTEPHP